MAERWSGGKKAMLALAVLAVLSLLVLGNVWDGSSGSAALTAPEIAGRARAALVQIRAFDADRRPFAEGTGFFITSTGLIATNLHVIEDGSFLEVESSRGDIYDIVDLVAVDVRRDIAIIKVPVDDASPLSFAEDADPAVGEQVFVMGNPLGQVGTFSNGLVSAHRAVDGVTLLQITAPISSGSSGGPVMNAAGKVVGLATLMLEGGQNLNYAVPTRYVQPLATTSDAPRRFSLIVLAEAIGRRTDQRTPPPALLRPSPERAGTTDAIGPQFRSVDSLVRARGGVTVGEIVRGELDESAENVHPVTLSAGTVYVIAAFCDDDCTDLDLVLRAVTGTPLQSGTEDNDSPILRVEAKASGEHGLVVHMAKCSVAPCAYGVRLYRLPKVGTSEPDVAVTGVLAEQRRAEQPTAEQRRAVQVQRRPEDCGSGPVCFASGAYFELEGAAGSASAFYERACQLGDPRGCVNLGVMFEAGRGVVKSRAEAARAYERGCRLNSETACTFLRRIR